MNILRHKDLAWSPQPRLPSGAEHAQVFGNPAESGNYIFRLRVPPGVVVNSHTHPDDRIYTVLSGIFYIGFGNSFDRDSLEKCLPGDVIFVPAHAAHFQYSESEPYQVQVEGFGPTSVDYIRKEDEPRLK